MSCPDELQLRALASGAVAPDHEVAVHVSTCPACAAALLAHAGGAADSTRTVAGAPQSLSEPPAPRRASAEAAAARTIGGRYVIVSELGEGGMGTVYAAHDTELGRRVALKLVKAEPGSDEDHSGGQERLLREAQAMAQLSHPNVLQVFDAGHHEGGVFLTMELVQGQDVRAWLNHATRGWKEIVSVFLKAGAGLAAAHDAGLIHRDFKPPNVLLGDDGRVRVADFGIARATGAQPEAMRAGSGSGDPLPGAERLATPLTAAGHVVGTMGYVAPELLAGKSALERSDQFSFCVSLYEALYGVRPFAGKNLVQYHSALMKGPPQTPPPGSHIPRWLFAVVVRGLSLDPEDRFPTLRALLSALEKDPAIRLRRVLAVGAGVALAFGLVGATVLLTRQPARDCRLESQRLQGVWDEPTRAAMRASFERQGKLKGLDTFGRVEKRLDDFAAQWTTLATDACLQDQSAAGAIDPLRLLRVVCLDERRAELAALTLLLSNADEAILGHAIGATQRLTEPKRCLDEGVLRRASLATPTEPALRARADALRVQLLRAQVMYDAGKITGSTDLVTATVAQARELGLKAQLAEGLLLGAAISISQAKNTEAETQLREALASAEAHGADDLVVRTAALLGWLESIAGNPSEAKRDLATARSALRRLDGVDHLTARVTRTEAAIEAADGHFEKALELERSAVALLTRSKGAAHPDTLAAINGVANYTSYLGRMAEASEQFSALATYRRETLGTDNPELCLALNNLGYTLTQLGTWARADAALTEAVSCAEATLGPSSPMVGYYLSNLGLLQARVGDPRAVQTADRAIALLPEDNEDLAVARMYRGRALIVAGAPAEAVTECARTLAFAEQHQLVDTFMAEALTCQGQALLALGRPREAVVPLSRAAQQLDAPTRFAGDRQEVRFALARALWDSKGDRQRAVTLATLARDDLHTLPDRRAEQQAIVAWLASHPLRGRPARAP